MTATSDTTDVMGTRGPGPPTRPSLGKLAAGLFSLLMVAAVAMPVTENWRTKPKDNFPLSYYPMFSYRRAPIQPVTYLAAVDGEGNRRRLHYRYAARGGMNQVRKMISKMVRDGHADDLCKIVAQNIGTYDKGWRSRVVAIEIRTETYDLREYFTATDRMPIEETVHSTCAVERPK